MLVPQPLGFRRDRGGAARGENADSVGTDPMARGFVGAHSRTVKTPNLKGYAIAGAAAIFAAFTGSARASPMSMHDNWDTGTSAWNWSHAQPNNIGGHAFDVGNWDQRFTGFSSFSLIRPESVAEFRDFGSSRSHHHSKGSALTPLSSSIAMVQPSVPDGGATAFLLMGALGALVFVRRKLSV